jgi:hypothetical protein
MGFSAQGVVYEAGQNRPLYSVFRRDSLWIVERQTRNQWGTSFGKWEEIGSAHSEASALSMIKSDSGSRSLRAR